VRARHAEGDRKGPAEALERMRAAFPDGRPLPSQAPCAAEALAVARPLAARARESNAEIADRLALSVRTAESHVPRAMRKLGVSDPRDVHR
jgi:DNA-binding NarL/FixJ family response regulator